MIYILSSTDEQYRLNEHNKEKWERRRWEFRASFNTRGAWRKY